MKSANETEEQEKQRQSAEEVVKRDTPTTKQSTATPSQESNEREQVYRPDANIDNQKGSHPHPHHGPDYDEKEFPGWQAGDKRDHKENINEKAEEADNSRRQG